MYKRQYYNRTLLSGAGYDEMERLAASGDWTIGRLRELAETVAAETMEKRSPDSSRDIFGYSSYYNDDDFLLSLWQTSGVRAFGDSAGQPLELRYDFGKAQSALDELGAGVYKRQCIYSVFYLVLFNILCF